MTSLYRVGQGLTGFLFRAPRGMKLLLDESVSHNFCQCDQNCMFFFRKHLRWSPRVEIASVGA